MELKVVTVEEFDAFYPIKMKALSGTPWIRVDKAKKTMVFYMSVMTNMCGI